MPSVEITEDPPQTFYRPSTQGTILESICSYLNYYLFFHPSLRPTSEIVRLIQSIPFKPATSMQMFHVLSNLTCIYELVSILITIFDLLGLILANLGPGIGTVEHVAVPQIPATPQVCRIV